LSVEVILTFFTNQALRF